MKVTASIYASILIPGNDVTDALADLQVTMGANPRLAIISVGTNAGLGGVFDPAFDFAASQTKADSAQIELFDWFGFRLAATWAVASWH